MPSSRHPVVASFAIAASCLVVFACSGGAGDGADDVGEGSDPLTGSVTTSFQAGVLPSTAYAGAHDTTLSQTAPTTTFGAATTVRVDGDDVAGSDLAGLLSWDLSSIPAGSTVRSATITLDVTNSTGNPFQLYEIDRAWSEATATWSVAASGVPWTTPGAKGAGDRGTTALATVEPRATGAYTVTLNAAGVAAIQRWVDSPSTNHGFIVANASSGDGFAFSSREATTASRRPRLTVGYDPASAAADAGTTRDATATLDAGGGAPIGDLPGWRQIFVEDFTRPAALGTFTTDSYYGPRFQRTYPYPWKDTSKHGTYDPGKTLSVANGMLDADMHTDGTEICVAAVEPTLPLATRGQTYGRYAIRFRVDAVAGYKTAWLLWPDSGLRSEGEIDFPEGNLDGVIKAFMHYASNDGTANSLGVQDAFASTATYPVWHTSVIEWSPGRVNFVLDGKVLGTSTTSQVPSRPMHWVIQSETALSGALPSTSAHAHVSVDWLAVWAYAP